MRIVYPPTVEPISLAMARKQCKVDPEPGTSPPSHPDDELFEVYITAAREWVEASLGMKIAPTTVALDLDAFPAGDIVLESGPVLGVIDVSYIDSVGAMLQVDPLIYVLDTRTVPARLRLLADEVWPNDVSADLGSITVSYQIGYSAAGESPQDAPLPRSIKLAMLLLISHLNMNREETVERALSNIPFGVQAFLRPIQERRGFA